MVTADPAVAVALERADLDASGIAAPEQCPMTAVSQMQAAICGY